MYSRWRSHSSRRIVGEAEKEQIHFSIFCTLPDLVEMVWYHIIQSTVMICFFVVVVVVVFSKRTISRNVLIFPRKRLAR